MTQTPLVLTDWRPYSENWKDRRSPFAGERVSGQEGNTMIDARKVKRGRKHRKGRKYA